MSLAKTFLTPNTFQGVRIGNLQTMKMCSKEAEKSPHHLS